ncbi:MAG TPA: CHAT domain-containing protein [Trichocoleus sp.]
MALEGRGEEKIRLQARVTGKADRSTLSAEYFERYQEIASLPYGDVQSVLGAMTEKDERIRSLENMVMTAMKSDKFYVETYYNFGESDNEDKLIKKILILTANPQNTDKRRLDAEVREIQAGLERAKKRDQFEIISKWAVRPEDLRRALLDYEPQIVHFSGYGAATEGLALEAESGKMQFVSASSLAKLFEMFKDKIECVLLNACYSEAQAEAIRQHINYVIGMHQVIGEQAALEFSVGFYDALGAGRSIEDALKLGCISIDLEGIPASLTPVLKRRKV